MIQKMKSAASNSTIEANQTSFAEANVTTATAVLDIEDHRKIHTDNIAKQIHSVLGQAESKLADLEKSSGARIEILVEDPEAPKPAADQSTAASVKKVIDAVSKSNVQKNQTLNVTVVVQAPEATKATKEQQELKKAEEALQKQEEKRQEQELKVAQQMLQKEE